LLTWRHTIVLFKANLFVFWVWCHFVNIWLAFKQSKFKF
jgi:hypothetical protein